MDDIIQIFRTHAFITVVPDGMESLSEETFQIERFDTPAQDLRYRKLVRQSFSTLGPQSKPFQFAFVCHAPSRKGQMMEIVPFFLHFPSCAETVLLGQRKACPMLHSSPGYHAHVEPARFCHHKNAIKLFRQIPRTRRCYTLNFVTVNYFLKNKWGSRWKNNARSQTLTQEDLKTETEVPTFLKVHARILLHLVPYKIVSPLG